jgi:S1-C subfamily serine protease
VPATLEDIVSRAIPAVVLVETSGGRGSAFFVTPDTLLTNAHVVSGYSSVTIRASGGATTTAYVTKTAPDFDLAMLHVADPKPDQATIPLGSVNQLRAGQEVIAIGSPLGVFQNSVTRGIVSSLRQMDAVTLVQTDAALTIRATVEARSWTAAALPSASTPPASGATRDSTLP